MDKHTVALICIAGSSLDVLGTLYLAYDLLGGEHGPLRTLTRAMTYGALFGSGYGLALGPVFGLASGLAHGLTLTCELLADFAQCSETRILVRSVDERHSRVGVCPRRRLFLRAGIRSHIWLVEHRRSSGRLPCGHSPHPRLPATALRCLARVTQ